MAFLCDISNILNQLNLSLQGRNKSILQLLSSMKYFERKLQVIITQLKNFDISNLEKTKEIFNELYDRNKLTEYSGIITDLFNSYNRRFQDFKLIESTIELHDYPLNCDINKQPPHFRNELQLLRNDLSLPLEMGKVFWKAVSEKKYPILKQEIYKIYSMFGTTYNCEASFSTLKIIPTKLRNRVSNIHISDLMRIKCC